MYTVDWFKGKRVTVMGLGLHGGGLGTAKWMLRHGARVIVTDLKDRHALASSVDALDKEIARLRDRGKKPSLKLALGRHDEGDFMSVDMVVRNPGVPAEHPLLALAAKNGVPVESDTSLFFLLCPFRIAAVTGTRGKTTTTTLLVEMARLHDRRTVVAGNIRISALEALDRILKMSRREPHPPIVLELSSWQLENLEPHRLSPHIGVLTNIKEDHLNRYRDLEEYARAKVIIVAFQKPGDTAVLNADDARVAAIGESSRLFFSSKEGGIPPPAGRGQDTFSKVLWFSTRPRKGNGCFAVRGKAVLHMGGKSTVLFPLSKIRLKGSHNIPNVLAACAAAAAMGIAPKTIRRAALAFRGVPGRLEEVARRAGVTYINDTTATSPDAAIAAIKTVAMKRKVILLAGGADKNLRYEEMAKEIARRVKRLVLFEGAASDKIIAALPLPTMEGSRGEPRAGERRVGVKWFTVVRSMKDALAEARRHAKKGDVILLSPGAASFGLFVNEYDRGDQFVSGARK